MRDLEFGRFAEQVAAEYYLSRGYVIRERNWRYHKIEIDIIAQLDNIFIFIEVKARSGKDLMASQAVDAAKMRRMVIGADVYLKRMKGYVEYRYDIFALTGDTENYTYEVFEDAFVSPLM